MNHGHDANIRILTPTKTPTSNVVITPIVRPKAPPPPTAPTLLATPRECGGCTACCRVMRIQELNKPRGKRCPHEVPAGCGIYEIRPSSCQDFSCVWIRDQRGVLQEDERPDRVGLMLTAGPMIEGKMQILEAQEIFPDAAYGDQAQQMIRRLSRLVPVQIVKCAEQPLVEIRFHGNSMPVRKRKS